MRTLILAVAGCFVSLALAGDKIEPGKTVTWTGWFSNLDCAVSRAKAGIFTETNPDCAEQSIRKGQPPVFISEQAKAIFLVKDYAGVMEDLGYHMEIQARLSDDAKSLNIVSTKRLEYQGPACSRRKPAAKK